MVVFPKPAFKFDKKSLKYFVYLGKEIALDSIIPTEKCFTLSNKKSSRKKGVGMYTCK